MAKLGYLFTTSMVEPEADREFGLLPAGKYLAQITNLEGKNADNGAEYENATLEILEPEGLRGRKIWDFWCTYMPGGEMENERMALAYEGGRARLSSIARACGVETFDDTEVFKYIPVVIAVGIYKDKNKKYPDKNKIWGYSLYTEGKKIAQVATSSRAAAAPKTTKADPLNDEIPF